MALHQADFGDLQLFRPEKRALEIVRHRALPATFLETFRTVSASDPCACGRALQTRKTIAVRDTNEDPEFAPYRAVAKSAGFRAVQSTPIISGEGQVVGVLSTHFRHAHIPSAASLRVTSLYARQAAEILVRLRAEEERRSDQELVAKEMGHRLKNVLTIVQSIARQSRQAGSGLGAHSSAFEERLFALARAHGLLAENRWEAANIHAIISEQVTPIAGQQVKCDGPAISLGAETAYSLTLVLHELAVNARKHGALKNSDGCISITWKLNPSGDRAELQWIEENGPPVTPPSRLGFGGVLLNNLGRSQLVDITVQYPASGVICTISIPVSHQRY